MDIGDRAIGKIVLTYRLKVTMDAAAADRTFDMLMGNEVPPAASLSKRTLRMCRTWIFRFQA